MPEILSFVEDLENTKNLGLYTKKTPIHLE